MPYATLTQLVTAPTSPSSPLFSGARLGQSYSVPDTNATAGQLQVKQTTRMCPGTPGTLPEVFAVAITYAELQVATSEVMSKCMREEA